MKVRELMTTPVLAVRAETPLRDAAALLAARGVSGVPVVDGERRVLGVLSETDLVARMHATGGDARTAADAMSRPPVTIRAAAPVGDAAAALVHDDVARLPVVDERGALVGIVSRADLVRAFVRTDDQLEEAIRRDVLLHVLWLDPVLFDVSVSDGVATIGGRVDRHSMSDMIERAVRNLPGIVDVVNEVSWATEDDRIRPVTTDPVFPFSPR
jgi:CBS domain-containing protein